MSGGRSEHGVVFGNTYDKYGSRNPIVRAMMRGFTRRLEGCVDRAAPTSIHEVGCGEGYWGLRWARRGVPYRGTDFSAGAVEYARANARGAGLDPGVFSVRSVYDLSPDADGADLVVCCEVLEHLDDPRAALARLAAVAGRHLILSVPREPLWRVLNVLRGAYLPDLGNTPGHVQHWSRRAFVRLVAGAAPAFEVVHHCSPVPWTLLLCRRRTRPPARGENAPRHSIRAATPPADGLRSAVEHVRRAPFSRLSGGRLGGSLAPFGRDAARGFRHGLPS